MKRKEKVVIVKKVSESDIQMAIARWLTDAGYFFYSVPNELLGKLRAGVADLVVLQPNGRTVYLEVKTPTGKQSEHQKDFQNMVEFLGFQYHVVRSVEDVVHTFQGAS